MGQWGCRSEVQDSYHAFGRCGYERIQFEPTSFNFKDLSMNKAPTDYFSLKPVRGSSPTASLAADLSQNFHIDRRRSSLLRPPLLKSKGHSTTSVSLKTAKVESQLPPFRFGNGPSILSPPLGSLEECLTASPDQEKRPHSANAPVPLLTGPPKLKQPFSSLVGQPRCSGLPLLGHIRKPSANAHRPRKQFRRSLSMFEHPGDLMKEEKAEYCPTSGLDCIMDTDDNPQDQLGLPHFVPDVESLPRITKQTLIDVLDGKFDEQYDQSLIIDCRFEYEYEGGHIDGAENFNSKEELASRLFESIPTARTLLIFHCEYSIHRAPLMAKFLRHKDRAVNAHRYPLLNYPEVYILDGGYSSFFTDHRLRCSPQDYVAMGAKEHANACERGLGRIKQQRTKLSRAQTFAFGQHNQPLEDSPTACTKQTSALLLGSTRTGNDNPDTKRWLSRLASY
ncbi:MAG: hypothetical protein Q9167_000333 [Letrouitia subvulpina]